MEHPETRPWEGRDPTPALGGTGDRGHAPSPRPLTQRTFSAAPQELGHATVHQWRVVMRADMAGAQEWIGPIPRKGERIELLLPRLGIRPRGTVFYADQLQIL